jgi:small subunit ribosomal protein S5
MGPKKSLKSRSEWLERVVAIERVTKVVKGGKKMSFRAIIVVGNEQGKVGVGVGKAGDVITAVRKGVTDGKKTHYHCTFNQFQLYTAPYKW